MNKNNRIKEGSTVATVILYAIVVLIIFITVYPMYYVLIMSLSSGKAAASMKVYADETGKSQTGVSYQLRRTLSKMRKFLDFTGSFPDFLL